MKEKGAHGMTAQTIRKELGDVFTDMADFAFRDMV